MSSQTERLERAAAEERELLGAHLDQLQKKLERALDPAALYDRHPLPILAAALLGGVVLGAVTRSDGPSRRRQAHRDDDSAARGRGFRGGLLHDGMAQLRGALVGMVIAKVAEKVQDMTTADTAPRTRRSKARAVEPDARARRPELADEPV